MNERLVAARILTDIEKNGAYSNLSLGTELVKIKDARSKNFISMVVYGVIENKIYLEYIIAKLSKVKLKKLDTEVKVILLLSLYQLIYMSKIPESAVLNEGVKLVGKLSKNHNKAYVNAVLRNFLRQREYCENIDTENKKEFMSIRYSAPFKFINILGKYYDTKFIEEYLEYSNKRHYINLRVNSKRINRDEFCDILKEFNIDAEKSEISSSAIILKDGLSDYILIAEKKGFVSIQDQSSQKVFDNIKDLVKTKQRVLDLCAAPGGKSMHCAEIIDNEGKVTACDIWDHKLKLIGKQAKRLGLSNIELIKNDALKLNKKFIEKFDIVLSDVPCSGSGIINRKPEIKYNIDESKLFELGQKQRGILKNASLYVKKGGMLIYSTCSILKCENEDVVEDFLEENENFENVEHINLNYKDGCDGFYICYMKRVE